MEQEMFPGNDLLDRINKTKEQLRDVKSYLIAEHEQPAPESL